MHIRPEAYKKDLQADTEGATTSTDFLGDLERKAGRGLTPKEKDAIASGFDEQSVNTTDDIDIIERV